MLSVDCMRKVHVDVIELRIQKEVSLFVSTFKEKKTIESVKIDYKQK